jgi:hypothetical protein
VTDLGHRSNRIVEQRPDVVHDRLLQLAARLSDEAPPIEPGTNAATLLGITGSLGIEVADRGPSRIELRTTRGRVRAQAAAIIGAADGGRSSLAIGVAIEPQGMAANLMLNVALGTRPNLRQEVVDGLEEVMTDLATELAKPEADWDPVAWRPPHLGR